MALHAAAFIPWREIIRIAPAVVGAARDLWSQRNAPPAPVDTKAEIRDQVAAIVQRLQALEAAQTQQADLARQIAEQVQGLSVGLQEAARRAVLACWLGGGALGLACAALLVLLLRG